ncbi:glycosyltransferase family 4 protein [Methyloligella sp. 2.7D]|uniref:glycosyltransferase family 4 protein n=1 Tax=unclassified Methyloligella TaxID=2625955 RepID=UPI00157C9BD7|nr:glycosyltransferase family 4 protein [Methyloligella sp. GL2]QKP77681.1 glycosyltransferase family 4 protein [Methyloligella sp. GL2]
MTPPSKPLVAFMYLGRRGALGRFTYALAETAAKIDDADFAFVISANSEIAPEFEGSGLPVTKIKTFERAASPDLVTGFFEAKRELTDWLAKNRPAAVVTLMPHIWTPALAPAIQKMGVKYLTIIHDAVRHPGDQTGWMTRWMRSEAKTADLTITLSHAVADRLIERGLADPRRVFPLYHPDLHFGDMPPERDYDGKRPLRLLFFGRIMKYKGLPLFVDAMEILREQGVPIEVGLAGSGDLGPERTRLERLGAEIINRWIPDSEIHGILSRYDAMACSHMEASQSGVVCAAFGTAMPVVAMPVGGIAEQVVDGETGVLSRRMTPQGFAEAVKRLATEPGLYQHITTHLTETAENRSMERFLREIVGEIGTL